MCNGIGVELTYVEDIRHRVRACGMEGEKEESGRTENNHQIMQIGDLINRIGTVQYMHVLYMYCARVVHIDQLAERHHYY